MNGSLSVAAVFGVSDVFSLSSGLGLPGVFLVSNELTEAVTGGATLRNSVGEGFSEDFTVAVSVGDASGKTVLKNELSESVTGGLTLVLTVGDCAVTGTFGLATVLSVSGISESFHLRNSVGSSGCAVVSQTFSAMIGGRDVTKAVTGAAISLYGFPEAVIELAMDENPFGRGSLAEISLCGDIYLFEVSDVSASGNVLTVKAKGFGADETEMELEDGYASLMADALGIQFDAQDAPLAGFSGTFTVFEAADRIARALGCSARVSDCVKIVNPYAVEQFISLDHVLSKSFQEGVADAVRVTVITENPVLAAEKRRADVGSSVGVRVYAKSEYVMTADGCELKLVSRGFADDNGEKYDLWSAIGSSEGPASITAETVKITAAAGSGTKIIDISNELAASKEAAEILAKNTLRAVKGRTAKFKIPYSSSFYGVEPKGVRYFGFRGALTALSVSVESCPLRICQILEAKEYVG